MPPGIARPVDLDLSMLAYCPDWNSSSWPQLRRIGPLTCRFADISDLGPLLLIFDGSDMERQHKISTWQDHYGSS